MGKKIKKIKLYFKWFDFWVGWYYDIKENTLYIQPLPMLGIKIQMDSICATSPVKTVISKTEMRIMFDEVSEENLQAASSRTSDQLMEKMQEQIFLAMGIPSRYFFGSNQITTVPYIIKSTRGKIVGIEYMKPEDKYNGDN